MENGEYGAFACEDMFGTDGTKYGEEYYNNTFKKKQVWLLINQFLKN